MLSGLVQSTWTSNLGYKRPLFLFYIIPRFSERTKQGIDSLAIMCTRYLRVKLKLWLHTSSLTYKDKFISLFILFPIISTSSFYLFSLVFLRSFPFLSCLIWFSFLVVLLLFAAFFFRYFFIFRECFRFVYLERVCLVDNDQDRGPRGSLNVR